MDIVAITDADNPVAVRDGKPSVGLAGTPAECPWDPKLAVAIAECGLSFEEEAVANCLPPMFWRQCARKQAVIARGKGGTVRRSSQPRRGDSLTAATLCERRPIRPWTTS